MDTLKPSEFAKRIGVCLKTVQSWDNKGVFPAKRTPTGRRYYTQEDIELYFRSTASPHDGRWVCLDEGKVKCSVCGATYEYDDNYCGNCGARMVWDKEEIAKLSSLRRELVV